MKVLGVKVFKTLWKIGSSVEWCGEFMTFHRTDQSELQRYSSVAAGKTKENFKSRMRVSFTTKRVKK